jgi:hypothetical protein
VVMSLVVVAMLKVMVMVLIATAGGASERVSERVSDAVSSTRPPRCLNSPTLPPTPSHSPTHSLDTLYAREHCYHCAWAGVRLAVVLLYHNECNSLRALTREWRGLPPLLREHTRLLVVDDNSQLPACDCVHRGDESERVGASERVSERDSGISVVRISNSRPWNIGGARNLGAFFSCAEFLFVCDIDAYISETLLRNVLALTHTVGARQRLHQLNRNLTDTLPHSGSAGSATKIHPGMMLLTRDAYWANHGCDEDFVGTYSLTH